MSAPFAKAAIGTSAIALSATSKPVVRNTLIVALPSNTGTVYVGDATVTAGIGIPLPPGQVIRIPAYAFSDASSIYLIGSASGQEVRAWVDVDAQIGASSAGADPSASVTIENKKYTAPVCGELAGSATAVQNPNVACSLVKFKASYDNAGRVYLGVGSGVTKADGTTDTTTGLQLSAGEETGWIPCDNLNRFWRICDNAGDDLTYLALA